MGRIKKIDKVIKQIEKDTTDYVAKIAAQSITKTMSDTEKDIRDLFLHYINFYYEYEPIEYERHWHLYDGLNIKQKKGRILNHEYKKDLEVLIDGSRFGPPPYKGVSYDFIMDMVSEGSRMPFDYPDQNFGEHVISYATDEGKVFSDQVGSLNDILLSYQKEFQKQAEEKVAEYFNGMIDWGNIFG